MALNMDWQNMMFDENRIVNDDIEGTKEGQHDVNNSETGGDSFSMSEKQDRNGRMPGGKNSSVTESSNVKQNNLGVSTESYSVLPPTFV